MQGGVGFHRVAEILHPFIHFLKIFSGHNVWPVGKFCLADIYHLIPTFYQDVYLMTFYTLCVVTLLVPGADVAENATDAQGFLDLGNMTETELLKGISRLSTPRGIID